MPAPGERGNSPSRSPATPAHKTEADCVPCSDLAATVVLVALMIFLVIYSLRYQIFVDFVVLCLCWFMELLANNILLSFDAGLPQIDPTAGRAEENHNNAGEIVAQQEITSPLPSAALPTPTSSVEWELLWRECESLYSTGFRKGAPLPRRTAVLRDIPAQNNILGSPIRKRKAEIKRAIASGAETAICSGNALSPLAEVAREKEWLQSALNASKAENERLRAQNIEAKGKIASLEQNLSDAIRKAQAASLKWKERLDVLERRMALFEWAGANLDPITKDIWFDAFEGGSPMDTVYVGNGEREVAKVGQMSRHILANRTNIVHTER
ncbi:hypothetical protein BD410DRAFT_789275 [Rickenella mellea]|uniref:Uncharacterized protein n=1 Tax=Rickenella mellea TaxID=50990 RepID=A0A4Y7Q2I7_9AGAM|nr:hypothetical protein BD410DRAFT_789275 [Rickenella mellea]